MTDKLQLAFEALREALTELVQKGRGGTLTIERLDKEGVRALQEFHETNTGHGKRLDYLERHDTDHDERLEVLEKQILAFDCRITAAHNTLSEIREDMEGIKMRIDIVVARVAKLEARLR